MYIVVNRYMERRAGGGIALPLCLGDIMQSDYMSMALAASVQSSTVTVKNSLTGLSLMS